MTRALFGPPPLRPMEFRELSLGVVDSTSERAFSALAAGEARSGDVFVATGQSAGRGRRGASWHSPEGEGLYASVVFLPPPPPVEAPALTMAAGLAVLEALHDLGALDVRLKWPNDIVDGSGAKLCGILVETRGFDPAQPAYVVGIGLDVSQTGFPAELERQRAVTSLARMGLETTPERALRCLLPRLGERLEQAIRGPEEVAGDYLQALGLRGRQVRVFGRLEGEEKEGPDAVVGSLADISLASGLTIELWGDPQHRGPRTVTLSLGHVRSLTAVDDLGGG